MENAEGKPFVLNTQRQTDLEKIAAYFEDQAWDSSWPDYTIFALARVTYPTLAPFTVVLDGESVPEGDKRLEDCELFTMQDVRDNFGLPLPKLGNKRS